MNRFTTLKSLTRLATLGLIASAISLGTLPAQAAPILKPIPGVEAPQTFHPDQIKPIPGLKGPGTIKPIKPIPGLKGPGTIFDPNVSLSIGSPCLTNKQIRKGLSKAGFEDIEFVKELKKKRVRVEALYEDGWVYSMRVDRCDREVDQIEALYEEDDFDIEF